jgi:NADP-dependent alcohol dehydrogenase
MLDFDLHLYMNNFEISNPTQIIFGKDNWSKLAQNISNFSVKKNIMITIGGGSVKKNGFLNKILSELTSFEVTIFEGIEANPEYQTCLKAAALICEKKCDFILAIGGGSVIDASKYIAGIAHLDQDPWETLVTKDLTKFKQVLPLGCILTLPATGSESNTGMVISRSEINEKRAMGGAPFFPKFAFLDPTFVATLPQRQIANGIIDAFTHTTEQYITVPVSNKLQERQAEAILSTLIEIGEKVLLNPSDYDLASNLMWCANQALNGSLRCGVPTDWGTHMIGHELTALHGVDHAQSLAIIGPRLFESLLDFKVEKLAQYGRRVWGLSGINSEVARNAIVETERFFQRLGVKQNYVIMLQMHPNQPLWK